MALIDFGTVPFDASLVAFDKDGTLIDFESMWGRLAEAWVDALTAGQSSGALARELYRSFGYDPQQHQTAPQSPLAIATTAQLQAIAASVLYRHGVPWPEADDRTRMVVRPTGVGLALGDLIRPAGKVAKLLAQLRGAGVRVAVVTTDSRGETEETLRFLRIMHLVDGLVCGDDHVPSKPAPDMLLAVCENLRVEPAHTVVVGDTMGDLLMAERGGAGLKVAVLTGAGNLDLLAAHADVLVNSIDDIAVRA
jgi:phosphoglycolate phosphatase-like HAD superfamily hydrolase